MLEEERLILEPLVDDKVEPRINLIRLLQRISKAQSEYQATLDQIPNLQEKLKRTSVRAPMDGIINRILNNTTGGVVQPASPILRILKIKHFASDY